MDPLLYSSLIVAALAEERMHDGKFIKRCPAHPDMVPHVTSSVAHATFLQISIQFCCFSTTSLFRGQQTTAHSQNLARHPFLETKLIGTQPCPFVYLLSNAALSI